MGKGHILGCNFECWGCSNGCLEIDPKICPFPHIIRCFSGEYLTLSVFARFRSKFHKISVQLVMKIADLRAAGKYQRKRRIKWGKWSIFGSISLPTFEEPEGSKLHPKIRPFPLAILCFPVNIWPFNFCLVLALNFIKFVWNWS